ncbi:MAG: hypothetical protein HDR22_11895 [Lachnospiraceae bacterium]|nr:hypothetical protein [Lachnospiraceae bacterium]
MLILKRYSIVGALIILCFFSAFIALCNGLLTTIQTNRLIQKENQYAYTNEVLVTIRTNQEIFPNTLSQITRSVDVCNVYVENMTIYFEEIDSVYRPDVILCQNEKLSLPTKREISGIPDGSIIAALSNIGDRNELSIHKKIFSVFETLDTDKYPFTTGLFVVNANDYFEVFPDALCDSNTVTLRISSNENDVYLAYSNIKNNLTDLMPKAEIYNSDIVTTESIFQSILSQENLISIGLFLFALINTIIISYYWVAVRRREIAIRKAFGASNFSVITLMASELLRLIGISAFFALAIQMLVWITQGNNLDMQGSLTIVIVLLLSIVMAVIIAMIVPVQHILQIQPSEGVKL